MVCFGLRDAKSPTCLSSAQTAPFHLGVGTPKSGVPEGEEECFSSGIA
jgi:hypothetical protein